MPRIDLAGEEFDETPPFWADKKIVIFFERRDAYLANVHNGDEACGVDHLKAENFYLVTDDVVSGKEEFQWIYLWIHISREWQNFRLTLGLSLHNATTNELFDVNQRQRDEWLKLVKKVSNEIIWDVDFETNTVFRGSADEKIFTYSTHEKWAKSNTWFSKVHPDDINELWSSLVQAFSGPNVNHWERKYRVMKSDFEVVYLLDRCLIFRNENKEMVRAIGSVLDVTESFNQIEIIKEQNIKLRKIAWMHSHVLRAPLARIMSLALHLKELEHNNESCQVFYDHLLNSCEEMDKVVEDIVKESEAIKINY